MLGLVYVGILLDCCSNKMDYGSTWVNLLKTEDKNKAQYNNAN